MTTRSAQQEAESSKTTGYPFFLFLFFLKYFSSALQEAAPSQSNGKKASCSSGKLLIKHIYHDHNSQHFHSSAHSQSFLQTPTNQINLFQFKLQPQLSRTHPDTEGFISQLVRNSPLSCPVQRGSCQEFTWPVAKDWALFAPQLQLWISARFAFYTHHRRKINQSPPVSCPSSPCAPEFCQN